MRNDGYAIVAHPSSADSRSAPLAGAVDIRVLESIGDVRTLIPSDQDFLPEQVLRECDRLEDFRAAIGLTSRYVVATRGGDLVGFVPVYPTPDSYLPATRLAALFADSPVPPPEDWRTCVFIGSDGMAGNRLAVDPGLPGAGAVMIRAALRLAAGYHYDFVCLPHLDDAAYALAAPAFPAEPGVVGTRREAYLDLPFASFDEYVAALPSSARTKVRRQRRSFLESGLTVRRTSLAAEFAELAPMLAAVERKYGSGVTVANYAWFLESCGQAMAEADTTLVVEDGDERVGFGTLWRVGRDLYDRCWGCDYDQPALRTRFVYFNVTVYEAIEHAIATGARRLLLGSGSLSSKQERGATLHRQRSVAWDGRSASVGRPDTGWRC